MQQKNASIFSFVVFKKGYAALLCCMFLFTNKIHSQQSPVLYLNCVQVCYEDYLKQELSAFAFTRDRFLADVDILVNFQEGANGGRFYTSRLIGKNEYAFFRDSTSFSIEPNVAEDEIRLAIKKSILSSLYKMCLNKACIQQFEISLKEGTTAAEHSNKDLWNYWVFAPGAEGEVETETNYTAIQIAANLNVQRITNMSKFTLRATFGYSFTRYNLDSNISLSVKNFSVTPLYAVSVGDHWSVGGIARAYGDEFHNIRRGFSAAPLLEYNIFPYRVNASKQLRLVYQPGLQYQQYYRTTVFNKRKDWRPYHRLSFITEAVQPWGSIRSNAFADTYLDNWNQYSANLNLEASFRLFKGLFLQVEGGASFIKNQISLVKETLPDDIYLLGGQQLPTGFYTWCAFGITYTFGSVRNSIVNPRFGQVE